MPHPRSLPEQPLSPPDSPIDTEELARIIEECRQVQARTEAARQAMRTLAEQLRPTRSPAGAPEPQPERDEASA